MTLPTYPEIAKDFKGPKLTTDDLRHYAKIITALTETDMLMKAIGWV